MGDWIGLLLRRRVRRSTVLTDPEPRPTMPLAPRPVVTRSNANVRSIGVDRLAAERIGARYLAPERAAGVGRIGVGEPHSRRRCPKQMTSHPGAPCPTPTSGSSFISSHTRNVHTQRAARRITHPSWWYGGCGTEHLRRAEPKASGMPR